MPTALWSMRSSSQTDEEASPRSWVLINFISAFRRLAVSIASERQMELQSDVWRLCRKCFVSFSVYSTIFA
jgi:hypothetical protein